jgi:Tetracyclin repressor-like, C-terminal domain
MRGRVAVPLQTSRSHTTTQVNSAGEVGVVRVVRRFWATRLAQVGPMVERAVSSGQLPRGTNPDDLMRYLAAPLFYRLLVAAVPLTQATADQAAAALAAARAGVFTST